MSVNLTNNCDGNQLNYNNDLRAIGSKNYALQKPFETDFLQYSSTQNSDRHSPFVEWPKTADRVVAHGTQFRTFNIFFYVKLFAIIILS